MPSREQMKKDRLIFGSLYVLLIAGLGLTFSAALLGSNAGITFLVSEDLPWGDEINEQYGLIVSRTTLMYRLIGLTTSLASGTCIIVFGFVFNRENILKMDISEYLSGLLAGLVLIALWYVQNALGFAVSGSPASDILYILIVLLFPAIPAICLFHFLKHQRLRFVLIKIIVFLIFSFVLLVISQQMNLTYWILNAIDPGYGRLSAGGGFALMISSAIYFGFNGIAVIVALVYPSFTKNRQGAKQSLQRSSQS